MKKVQNRLKNWIDTDKKGFIRTLLLTGGFGFCLCLSFVWGRMLDVYGGVSGHVFVSLLISLFAGALLTLILMSVWALSGALEITEQPGDAPDTPGAKDHVRPVVWIISAAVFALLWTPVWLAYFPAVFSYDAEWQLGQVISGPYTTHHPLLHTLIMGGCMKLMWNLGGINAGMALYAVLQLLIMAVICGWIMAEAHRLDTPRRWLIVYGVFLAVFPVHGILAISTTKDTVFAGLIVILALMMGRRSGLRRELVIISVLSCLLVLFRNNAVYALAGAAVILVICFLRKRDEKIYSLIAAALIAGCIAGCLFNTGLKAACRAESGSIRESLSIPIQQLARIDALHADDLPEQVRADLEQILDGDVSDRYDAHLADPVKKRVNLKAPGLFVKTWFKLGLKYPGDYFDAWLNTTEGAWYIRDTSVNRIYGEGSATGFGYLSTDIRSMPPGFEVTPAPVFPGLKNLLESIVSDNSFEKIPVVRLLFSPALYVWSLVGYVYVCITRRKTGPLICLLVPAMLFATILLGPAILVRYMYPYMLLIILPVMKRS